jgi:hypothetical protein
MNPRKARARRFYGITRIDQVRERNRSQHCWRVRLYWDVSLGTRGRYLIHQNFPDRKHGGRRKALLAALAFRDAEIANCPDFFSPKAPPK